MTRTQQLDALNNSGLPQLAEKVMLGQGLNDADIKLIADTIVEFDGYYKSGWKESETRSVLLDMICLHERLK